MRYSSHHRGMSHWYRCLSIDQWRYLPKYNDGGPTVDLHVAISAPSICVDGVDTSRNGLLREPDLVLIVAGKRDEVQLTESQRDGDQVEERVCLTSLLFEAGATGAIDFMWSNGSVGEEPSPLRRMVIPAPVVLLKR